MYRLLLFTIKSLSNYIKPKYVQGVILQFEDNNNMYIPSRFISVSTEVDS